jgi:hypothetical protein
VRYALQIGNALNWPDVCGGVGKTIVGGLLIGAAGCFYGIHTGSGPRAVGKSTTQAVVAAIILIVATDGCFGVIYFFIVPSSAASADPLRPASNKDAINGPSSRATATATTLGMIVRTP